MQKIILITGSTDGIGLATAEMLISQGHHVLLHGRNPAKLEAAKMSLRAISADGKIESYVTDLSHLDEVEALAKAVAERHDKLDVLINNAGIFHTPAVTTRDGLDERFAVNTLAPYLLTQRLMPLLGPTARVINLSSAAQSPVDPAALSGAVKISDDFTAYAQSKLAITMWSRHLEVRKYGVRSLIFNSVIQNQRPDPEHTLDSVSISSFQYEPGIFLFSLSHGRAANWHDFDFKYSCQ